MPPHLSSASWALRLSGIKVEQETCSVMEATCTLRPGANYGLGCAQRFDNPAD